WGRKQVRLCCFRCATSSLSPHSSKLSSPHAWSGAGLVFVYRPMASSPARRSGPLKALFLQAPSFDGYDGGARARHQIKREGKSCWFPTWLAQAAAMVPGAKLIDAPPHRLSFKDIEEDVKSHDFIVIHTSTPSFKSDVRTAGMIRELNPNAAIGFIGAKVAV